jgi:surface-adhesin protein E
MRSACALALLILCVGAQAQDRELRRIPVSPQHDPLYLDPATVLRSGTQVSFRYVLDVPVAFDVPGRPRGWRSNEAAAVIDCARNTYSIEKVVAYAGPAGSGEIVGRHSGNAAEREPAAIVRDSTFDILARYLCQ